MSLSPVSHTSAAAQSWDPDSDVECYREPTSTTQYMEEEGDVSDWECTKPEQDQDQEASEEQTRRETIGGVRSFIGWKQVCPPLPRLMTIPLPVQD